MELKLEFKSFKDDAWYDARVVTEGRRLRIKFINFGDDEDEVVDAENLTSLDDVNALRFRFRKISSQFQDSDCAKVQPGLLVCVARRVGTDERKFYDAVLTGVVHKEHQVSENGEQVCKCSFSLEWIDSGEAGSCNVESICSVQGTQDEELDPALILFLEKAREGIKNASCSLVTQSGQPKSRNDTSTAREPLPLSNYTEDGRVAMEVSDGSVAMDVERALHMVIVENLEKDISPFTIIDFVQQQLSIECHVSISGSKSSELYTRAFILLEGEETFKKLSNFLESPDWIVISSAGRPWFVTEKKALHETRRESVEMFMILQTPLNSTTRIRNELNVVCSGSAEFMEAKERQIMFKEFTEHLCRLQNSLRLEEGKIIQKSKRKV